MKHQRIIIKVIFFIGYFSTSFSWGSGVLHLTDVLTCTKAIESQQNQSAGPKRWMKTKMTSSNYINPVTFRIFEPSKTGVQQKAMIVVENPSPAPPALWVCEYPPTDSKYYLGGKNLVECSVTSNGNNTQKQMNCMERQNNLTKSETGGEKKANCEVGIKENKTGQQSQLVGVDLSVLIKGLGLNNEMIKTLGATKNTPGKPIKQPNLDNGVQTACQNLFNYRSNSQKGSETSQANPPAK